MTAERKKPKKVAVLGGGVGSMVAAFELTQEENWQEKFEITVYQLGWRLGGKGASGRKLDGGMRIQEHGLHIWAGYYNNSFRMMRACYKALDRPPEIPIRTVEEAFRPVNEVFVSDFVDDHPHIWSVNFPTNKEKPGTGGEFLSPRDFLIEALDALKMIVERYPLGTPRGLGPFLEALPTELAALLATWEAELKISHLHAAAALARTLPQTGSGSPLHTLLFHLIEEFQKFLVTRKDLEASNPTLGSIVAMVEIGIACVKGMLADHVLEWGFDHLDDMEWTAWVMKHGASRAAMETAPGRCAYCYVFGSSDGIPDFEHRAVGAGTAMRALLRLLFTYEGSLFYKLNAGMGDIVFAPLYELLKRRGVKFAFFHQVTNLGLDEQGGHIATIDVEVQATLKDRREGAEYQPLIPDPGGLPCWPSTPLYDQLEQGEELKARNIRLESMWSGWKGTPRTLRVGEDFDLVVLGISIGGLPALTGELAKKQPGWQAMLDSIKTVATQSMQFWFKDNLAGLGWPAPGGVLTGYYEPMDTWSNMAFLLPREGWGPDGPKQISYFCSVFAPTEPAPPYGLSDYPARQLEAVKARALPWIDKRLPQLLPNTDGQFGRFNFDSLYDPSNATGPARLESQYWRVNVDPPSELYVQSVPGSTQHRLTADGSGFLNLFLAGDWLRTGLNAGCVEAATMGGLQAARAISGRDIKIVGERDVMESPLAAQNGPLPWSLAYARGDIASAIVTLALPATEVASLLAPGLKLLPQTITGAGLHPVGLIFAEQSDVRANFIPFGGMSYRECVIAIPYVGIEGESGTVPFMTLPALYLDKFWPTLAGWLMYGYRKHMARVDGTAETMDVHHELDDSLILQARLIRDGEADHPYAFEHLETARAMMGQPVITPHASRDWLYSFLDYQFDLGRITPLRGVIEIGATVLGNPARKTMHVDSVRTASLGGFRFDGKWTLTNPFESNVLKEMIDARASTAEPS